MPLPQRALHVEYLECSFQLLCGRYRAINEKPRDRVRGVFSEALFPPIAETI